MPLSLWYRQLRILAHFQYGGLLSERFEPNPLGQFFLHIVEVSEPFCVCLSVSTHAQSDMYVYAN